MKAEMIRSSALVSSMGAVRMALGLLSQMLIACYFGTARSLDVYFIVFALPSAVIGVSLALFSSGVVPRLSRIHDGPGRAAAVSSLSLYVFCIASAVALGGWLAGPWLIRLATGLSGGDLVLARRLSGLMWLVAGLETVSGFLASLYHLQKRFFLPTLLSLSSVAGVIFGTVVLSPAMGVAGMAAGWVILDAASILALSGILKGYRFSLRSARLDDPASLGVLKDFPPLALTILPFTILPSLDACFAPGLPEGSMSYLGYSTRISVMLSVLVTGGIYTVMLPYLSDNVKDNEHDAFRDGLRSSLRAVLAAVLPVAAFFYFFREPLLAAFLERGRFGASSLRGVSSALPFYLIGLVPMSLSTLVNRAYAAKGWYGRLGVLSVLLPAMYFILAGVLSGPYSYRGIGMAYAAYWAVFFLTTAFFLDRSLIGADSVLLGAKCVFNAAAGAGLARLAAAYLGLEPGLALASGAAAAGTIYILMSAYALKVGEVHGAAGYLLARLMAKKRALKTRLGEVEG